MEYRSHDAEYDSPAGGDRNRREHSQQQSFSMNFSSRGINEDSQSNQSWQSSQSPPTVPLPPDKDIKEIFDELFREKNISSNANWAHAVKLVSGDERYELLKSHPDRKQMFNNYKIQRAKEEKEEQRAKIKRCRENLEYMLNHSSVIDCNTRYKEACDLFKNNEAWKAVGDQERREIFRDIMEEMSVREREKQKETRKRNMKVLKDILEGMPDITFATRWQDTHPLLMVNPVFAQDRGLLEMDKEDALIVFQDHIRVLEREEEEERRRERKMIYRNQRKNREAFLSLLDQLHRQGKLTSISQWSALYPEISGDFRFSAMLTQPLSGSTPLDLFKFYVHDLRNRYEDDKEIIRDIIRRKNFEVAAETTYEEFVEVLSRDDRSEKIDAGNVKTIFEKLVARVHELEKMKLREEQRKKRKIENRFMNLIHSLDPAVDEKSIWEEVRRAISDDPDFIVIPTEEERIELFKKYIITVQESCSHHHSKPRKKVKKDRNRSLTPEEDSRSKERRKRRSFSVEEEDSRLSHEDSRRRRERPLTPHSPYDRHEIDLRDGERRRDDRLDRKRDPVYRCSRSPSPLRTGHSSRSSRGRSCEDVSSAHRHRKEGEERSPDLPLLLPKAVREPSRPKSPAESGEERETDREEVQAMDTSANNDEEEESDIEELERQRKILLQQLAAAASSD